MKKITKIVMTGGPAGGKTTFTTRLVKELTERGYRVLIVPEAATELMSGFGIKPFGNCLSMYDFQFFVIDSQLQKEKMVAKAAQLVPDEKVLILCDRGILDNKAYVSQKEFDQILSAFSLTEKEIIKSYDAVIHLVSSANGAEYAYSYNNAVRYETLEQAREQEELSLKSWQKHPHRVIIGNSYNFDNKIRKAMNEVYRTLGEIPPTESERKYLIGNPSQEILEKLESIEQVITQSYLVSKKDGTERRSRKVQNNGSIGYYYIEKQQISPVERIETERMLPQKEYVKLMDEVDPDYGTILKRRYSFQYKNHYMTIDTYAGSPTLAVLDVQVADKNDQAEIPEELDLIREVTGEERYQGHMIAKAHGVLEA